MEKEKIEKKQKEEMKQVFLNRFLDKTLDFILSKNNKKWIIFLFIIGFILRTLTALRNKFCADEMVHGTHVLGFISSGKLQIMDESAVWFWLTDLFTKIFGVSVFGLRFTSILFGSAIIILIYLIAKEIFNKKIALISSIILTFSSFQLTQMAALMDISMAFFVFLSMYFLILFLKKSKSRFFILTWVSLGVSIMIKSIALSVIPAFAIFLIYYNKRHFHKFKFKQIIYAGLIMLLLVTPILTFNYLLYKDKGLVDLQFARFTRISLDKYKDIAPTIAPFNLYNLIFPNHGRHSGIVDGLLMFYHNESIFVLFFAFLGLFFLFKNKNKFLLFLILAFLFPFLFLSGTSLLANHFVFGSFFISLLASISIINISEVFKQEKTKKVVLYSLLCLLILFSLAKVYHQNNGFFGKNELGKLIDFKNENIEPNSLVVVDSRIYRGRIAFMFYDRHYIETNYFSALMKNQNSWSGNSIPITTYYIEAATDDSGWGTVSKQPEFNKTCEEITDYFKKKAELVKTIYGIKGEKHFNIYRTVFLAKPQTISFADSTHVWFYYPVGYKPKGSNFDDYSTYNAFDFLLNKIAHLILYLDIVIAILLSFYIYFLLYKSS